jgi:hypothetical protein
MKKTGFADSKSGYSYFIPHTIGNILMLLFFAPIHT